MPPAPTGGDTDVFQLQMELADLRKRMKILDKGGERAELLEMVRERDEALLAKDRSLDLLNSRFYQITQAVQLVEADRRELLERHAHQRREKEGVERDLGLREGEVTAIAQRCAELEERLKKESAVLELQCKSLTAEKDELFASNEAMREELAEGERFRSEHEDRRRAEARVLEEQRVEIARVRDAIEVLNERLGQKDASLVRLKESQAAEIAELRSDAHERARKLVEELEQERSCATQAGAQNQKELEELRAQLKALREENESREVEMAELRISLSSAEEGAVASLAKTHCLEEEIVILRQELKDKSDLKEQLDHMGNTVQQVRAENDRASAQKIEKLQSELEKTLMAKAELEKSLQAELSAKRKETDAKKTKEKDFEVKLEEDRAEKERRQEEIRSLKESIKELVQQNAAVQGTSEAQISELRKRFENQKEITANVEADYQKKLSIVEEEKASLHGKCVEQSKNSNDMLQSLRSSSERKDSEILGLQAALQQLETSRLKDLEAKDMDIEKLERGALAVARSEVKALKESIAFLKDKSADAEVVSAEIVGDLEQNLKERESEVNELQQTIKGLTLSLERSRAQMTSDASTIAKKQNLLQSRTQLLGEMVKQNRELDFDLQEARKVVSELQEESDKYMQMTTSAALERDALKKKATKTENEWQQCIRHERRLREESENELMATKLEVEKYRTDFKDFHELSKENTALKDKIRRQEAYLKRKLKKEKVSRNPHKGDLSSQPSSYIASGNMGRRMPLAQMHIDELGDVLQDDV